MPIRDIMPIFLVLCAFMALALFPSCIAVDSEPQEPMLAFQGHQWCNAEPIPSCPGAAPRSPQDTPKGCR